MSIICISIGVCELSYRHISPNTQPWTQNHNTKTVFLKHWYPNMLQIYVLDLYKLNFQLFVQIIYKQICLAAEVKKNWDKSCAF